MKIKKFIDYEMKLTSGAPLLISNRQSSSSLLSYYLRAVLGRSDLSAVVQTTSPVDDSSFVKKLEKIRLLLRFNQLDEAEARIQDLHPACSVEENELTLEKVRLHLFRADWPKVIDLSNLTMQDADLVLSSRMTLHQLRGLAFCWLQAFQKSHEELDRAIEIAQAFPKANSGFIAHTIRVQTYSYQRDFIQAAKALEKVEVLLSNIETDEEWIEKKVQHLRCLSHFYRNQNELEKTTQALMQAQAISEWLELKVTQGLCQKDLKELNPFAVEERYVLRKKQWSYVPELKVILCDLPKTVFRLEDSEVTSRLIEILTRGPVHQDELLKQVWGLSGIEKYQAHLRTHLSKLRLKLPKGALYVKDQFVYLQ